jgi:N-methylhydantoinase B
MPDFDPIQLEVYWNRMTSIAEEQAKTLIRASFSTLVGEMEDLATGVYDEEGNIIAQGVTGTIGVLTGMTMGMKHFLRRFPASSLEPGDVLISNNPWLFSGHKFDVTVATPVFRQGRLVGLTACILHAADIGGRGWTADTREVFEEGLEIPIMKLIKAGEPNQELLELIEANVRFPRVVIGDFMAQVAANQVGASKLVEFMDEYGLESLMPLSQAINSRTEQAMRQAIAALPDGEYSHQVFMDGYDEPLRIAVTLRVQGEDLEVDFSGTSPQIEHGINGVWNFTLAFTAFALKSALVPDLPNNEGCFRPIHLAIPEGCFLNTKRPAPVAARHITVSFVTAAVYGALAQAAPGRVPADSGHVAITSLTGRNQQGDPFTYAFINNGGMGARPGQDGYSATSYPANLACVPVEIVESISPVFILRKEFIPDSGGPGKYRGGCDQLISLKVRSDSPTTLLSMYERTQFPALGLEGGRDGALAQVVIESPQGDQFRPRPKERCTLRPGDTLHISQGGGGGYGPPQERDPELVLKDVINGLVTAQAAEADYRVAIQGNPPAIDWERTRHLRYNRPREAQ